MAGSKRKYIEAAYELLLREGLEGVSSRKIASELGCSNSVIYKHFEDIDELIDLASIRFLQEYAEDARFLSTVDLNPLELNLQLWECFAYYSFSNAPIFENLFYKKNGLGITKETMESYFEEYPEEIEGNKDFMLDMLAGQTMAKRDSVLLKKAGEQGLLTPESVSFLCKLDTYLFRGFLASINEESAIPVSPKTATKDFMQLIVDNYQMKLEPGYSITAVDLKHANSELFKYQKKREGGIVDSYKIECVAALQTIRLTLFSYSNPRIAFRAAKNLLNNKLICLVF